MNKLIKLLMEIPLFYKLVQIVIGGQGHKKIKIFLFDSIPKSAKKILDQGCGTGEYSLLFPGRYTGLDNNRSDIKYASKKYQGSFIVGSADKMPFKSGSFDLTFAVGLHHHLPTSSARKAIKESLRVTKLGGRVVIVDAMWPKRKLNIIGLILRGIDRGRFIRSYQNTLKLIPEKAKFNYQFLSGFPLEYIAIIIDKI